MDGSVMDPLRTFGLNCVSIGGRVARLDGGGESMNIGVGPEFMPLEEGFAADSFIDCPAIRSVTEYEAAALVGVLWHTFARE